MEHGPSVLLATSPGGRDEGSHVYHASRKHACFMRANYDTACARVSGSWVDTVYIKYINGCRLSEKRSVCVCVCVFALCSQAMHSLSPHSHSLASWRRIYQWRSYETFHGGQRLKISEICEGCAKG